MIDMNEEKYMISDDCAEHWKEQHSYEYEEFERKYQEINKA